MIVEVNKLILKSIQNNERWKNVNVKIVENGKLCIEGFVYNLEMYMIYFGRCTNALNECTGCIINQHTVFFKNENY